MRPLERALREAAVVGAERLREVARPAPAVRGIGGDRPANVVAKDVVGQARLPVDRQRTGDVADDDLEQRQPEAEQVALRRGRPPARRSGAM